MDETRYFTKMYNLVLKLQNCGNAGLTKKEIADFLRCSMKTVERKTVEIERCFGDAFIESKGYPKTYRIRTARLSKKVSFCSDDVSALRQAADLLAKNNQKEKSERLSTLAEKVQLLAGKQESRDAFALMSAESCVGRPVPHKIIDESVVNTIKDAIKNWTAVNVKYTLKKSGETYDFILHPYGILYGDRNHYLLAAKEDAPDVENIHYYIMSNIEKIELLPEKRYAFPEDFSVQNYVKDLFGMYNEEPFDVEWLFSPKAADEASKFVFHPSQTMEKQKDGSLLVRFHAGGCLEMSWHLYTWCDQVKVLKPADFWQRVQKAREEWF